MKLKTIALSLLLGLTAACSSTSDRETFTVSEIKNEQRPYVFSEKIIKSLFNDLKKVTDSGKVKNNPDILKAVVKNNILPYLRIKYIGSNILGREFKDLSINEKKDFYAGLEKYLQLTYGQLLADYNDQDYEIVPESYGVVLASTRLKIKDKTPLVFRFWKNNKTNEWKLTDITKDYSSLIYSHHISKHKREGFKSLVDYLHSAEKTSIKLTK